MATNPTLPADKTALFTKKAKTYTSSVLPISVLCMLPACAGK